MQLKLKLCRSLRRFLLDEIRETVREEVRSAIGDKLDQILRQGAHMTELEQQLLDEVAEVKTATDDLAAAEDEMADRVETIITDLEKNPSGGVVTAAISGFKTEVGRMRNTSKALRDFHANAPTAPPVDTTGSGGTPTGDGTDPAAEAQPA